MAFPKICRQCGRIIKKASQICLLAGAVFFCVAVPQRPDNHDQPIRRVVIEYNIMSDATSTSGSSSTATLVTDDITPFWDRSDRRYPGSST